MSPTCRMNLTAWLQPSTNQEMLLERERDEATRRVLAVEEIRTAEATQHLERIKQVKGQVGEFMDQLKRARLDVDEWSQTTRT